MNALRLPVFVPRVFVPRVLVLFVAACLGACASSDRSTDEMLVIGHRGAPGYGAENTIAGFRHAVELGADGVELDLILTADERLAVIHDWTLNRLVGVEQLRTEYPDRATMTDDGPVWRTRDFTMAELERLEVVQVGPQSMDAAIGGAPAERRICSYEDALRAFDALRRSSPDLVLYTELKTSRAHMTGDEIDLAVDRIVEALVDTGEIDHPDHHWIQSFDRRAMTRITSKPELDAFDKAQLLSCEPGIIASANPVVLSVETIRTEEDLERFLQRQVASRGMTMVHGWKLMWWHLLDVKGIDVASVAHGLGLRIHAFTFRDERFESDYQGRPVLAPRGGPFTSASGEVAWFRDRGFDAVMTDTISSALDGVLDGALEASSNAAD